MGAEQKIVEKRCFLGKRHRDIRLENCTFVVRFFVVIAQAPSRVAGLVAPNRVGP